LFAELPAHVQRQAGAAYRLFQADPTHPGLHFKQVNAFPLMYSARVGISGRAICTRDGDAVVWFWIGSHDEYDHVLAEH